MRCPYCGGLNADQANFCARCGRDLKVFPPPNQQRQGFPPPPQGRPTTIPSFSATTTSTAGTSNAKAPYTNHAVSTCANYQTTRDSCRTTRTCSTRAAFAVSTTFSRAATALEEGALAYTVVHSTVGDGHKKIVRIVYPKCAGWQQVATLLKALKEQLEDGFDTIIIQGVFAQDTEVYSFTNGQLIFDRGVRLGDLILNRYQIETGNGFETDSVRIVLTE